MDAPKLSAKMPAQMDSQMDARFPSTIQSDAPATGGDGPEDAPQVDISRDSTQQDPEWENLNDDRPGWEAMDKKTGSEWELSDRKETDLGGRPQRGDYE